MSFNFYLKSKALYGYCLYQYRKLILRDKKLISFSHWRESDGDNTLLLNFSLTSKDIVYDIGGYHGDWSSAISQKYGSTINIFEAVPAFAELCSKRFNDFDNVNVFSYGLGAKAQKLPIYLSDNSSSMTKRVGKHSVSADIRPFNFVLGENKSNQKISLVKINIEGGEYDLLDYILLQGYAKYIKTFLIQFHDFIPNADSRRENIRVQLSQTHVESWSYDYIWEVWSIKV